MPKITIVGTGLIGASIGLALKKSGAKDLQIIGHDAEPNHASRAQKIGAVDKSVGNLPNAVEEAHIIVIATPLKAIADELKYMAPYLSKGAIVMDVASVKVPVLNAAKEVLPEGVSFVGTNPLVYKEGSGPDQAEAGLFEGKTFCVTPAPSADEEAIRTAVSLITAVGAKPYFMDPGEHDALIGAVHTLPFALAMTLAGTLSKSPSWGDMAQLASHPYKSGAGLASVGPVAATDLLLADSATSVYWIDEMIKALYTLRNQAEKGDRAKVETEFARAWEQHERLLSGKVQTGKAPTGPDIPKASESIGEMLMGRKLIQYQKRMMQDMERREKGPARGKDQNPKP